MSQIQGEFSALACPLPAPETRTQFKFSQHVSRNLGGVLPRKKGLGVNNAWSYSYGVVDSEDLRFDSNGQFLSDKNSSGKKFTSSNFQSTFKTRDIQIECSKQFKRSLYFYVFGQSRPFWAALKLL